MTDEGKLDPAVVASLYVDHAEELTRFLVGLTGDSALAADVLQATFAKVIEVGHTARAETRKAWLFKVAYNEAMAFRRRQAVGRKVVDQLGWIRPALDGAADAGLMRRETVAQVRAAIERLPPEQARVLRMRIYEEKKFATIAEELKIPLGTALARMQAALKKLRKQLSDDGEAER